MKYKELPVYFKDRIVTRMTEEPPVCTRVYDKYWRVVTAFIRGEILNLI